MLTAWPQHYFLKGHMGKVTCLLYPCDYSSAYNSNYLLSGGADFSVRLWDLYQGSLVHTFAVHGGLVRNIVACPFGVNVSSSTLLRSLLLVPLFLCTAETTDLCVFNSRGSFCCLVINFRVQVFVLSLLPLFSH